MHPRIDGTKLFATNELDAARLARDVLFQIDREPLYIAVVALPESVFQLLLADSFRADFQIVTIGIDPAQLATICSSGEISIRSFSPLPI